MQVQVVGTGQGGCRSSASRGLCSVKKSVGHGEQERDATVLVRYVNLQET